MLDLTNDPDRHMLHEAELNLASTLRLVCATYLCSKRRVFEARIEALKIGKEFRKTDAQQACKIDVNKASKLWQSFEKVGWFNPEYFRQYL
jgi:predicted DNA-binding ribbon-helix-helix protein